MSPFAPTPTLATAHPPAEAGRAARRAVLAIAALGVAWNLFGVLQFVRAFTATEATLTADGLSAAQAAVVLALPGWIDAVFALGVAGGLAGTLALALRLRGAGPLLATSLVAYVALAAGDAHHGLFAALPGHAAIIGLVVAIAAVLAATAAIARRQGQLR